MDGPTGLVQVGTPTRVTPAGALDRPPLLPELVPTVLYRLAVAVAVLALACYASKLARQLLGRRIARRFKRPWMIRRTVRLTEGRLNRRAIRRPSSCQASFEA